MCGGTDNTESSSEGPRRASNGGRQKTSRRRVAAPVQPAIPHGSPDYYERQGPQVGGSGTRPYLSAPIELDERRPDDTYDPLHDDPENRRILRHAEYGPSLDVPEPQGNQWSYAQQNVRMDRETERAQKAKAQKARASGSGGRDEASGEISPSARAKKLGSGVGKSLMKAGHRVAGT